MPPDQADGDRAPEPELKRDEEKAAGIIERSMLRVADVRSWVHRRPGGARAWQSAIALIGLIVIITGVVLLVLPGPGWVVIFVGLGIWATEFAWAKSLLISVRRTVGKCTAWIVRQPRWLTVLVGAVVLVAVAAAAVGVWLLAM